VVASRIDVVEEMLLRLACLLVGTIVGLTLAGCESLRDRVAYEQMSARLSYQGFSFERPPNGSWYFLRSEEGYTSVTLRRDLAPRSPTHDFYALVALGGIAREPTSHDEFAALARSTGRTGPYEIEELAYEQAKVVRQNQWCIRIDVAPGTPAS